MFDDMRYLVSREERAELRRNLSYMGLDNSIILRLLYTLDAKDSEIALLTEEVETLARRVWRYKNLGR